MANVSQTIAPINQTSTTNAGAGTIVLTVPAGIVDIQSFMVAAINVAGGTGATVTAPGGWTLINRQDSTTVQSLFTYYRQASSEPANYTFTLDMARQAAGGIVAYSNVANNNTPLHTNTGASVAASVNQNTVSVTSVADLEENIIVYSISTLDTLSTPGGYNAEFNTASTTQRIKFLDKSITPAGATGVITSTAGAAVTGVNDSILLNPAITDTETPAGGGTGAGVATVSVTIVFTPSGGATAAGTATVNQTITFTPSGGGVASGVALFGLMRIFYFVSQQINARLFRYQIIKYGDSDASITFPHQVGYAPVDIYFKPIDVPATIAGNNSYSPSAERFKYYTQRPFLSAVTATNLVVNFSTAGGTGSPAPQFEILINAPHTVID